MAYQFARSPNHQYLRTASVPTIKDNWVFSLWFKADNVTEVHTLLKVEFDDPDNNRFLLIARGDVTGDPVRWASQNEGTAYSVDTTGAFLANTWNHVVACTNISDNKLHVSLNGAAWDEVSGVKFPNGSPSYIQISGDNAYLPAIIGSIAEVAVWDAAYPVLAFDPTAQGKFLTLGYLPVMHPNHPLGWWRLLRGLNDEVGGRTLTAYNSPTQSDHCPVIEPSMPMVGKGAPPAITGSPWHYYRKRRVA